MPRIFKLSSSNKTQPEDSHRDATVIEDKIIRPIRHILYGKSDINENTSLVKKEVPNDELVQGDLPSPSANNEEQVLLGRDASFDNEKLKQMSLDENTAKGLAISIVGGGIMFGLAGVFVRMASENGVGSVEVLFVRSTFQTILFGIILLLNGVGWLPPSGRTRRCVLIAFSYSISTVCSYEALEVIPPGTLLSTRGAAKTIFATIFAYTILEEKVSKIDIIGLMCCFFGMGLLIASGIVSGDKNYILLKHVTDNTTLMNIYGYALIIMSGFLRSLGVVAFRGARDDLNTSTVVFYHSALTVIISTILLFTIRLPSWPTTWPAIGYVAATCVVSTIATYSGSQALKYVHPALASFGQNSDIIVSITLQHALLKMPPKALELSGVAIILFGLCGLTLYKWRNGKQNKKCNDDHERMK